MADRIKTPNLDESNQPTESIRGVAYLPISSQPDRLILPDLERSKEAIPTNYRKALHECQFGTSPWPLFVFGSVGTGKTFGALALADYVRWSLFYSIRELLREAADAACGRLQNEAGYEISARKFWRTIADARLIILDEIGSRGEVNDHHYNSVMELVDCRQRKPSIYLSNLEPEQLSGIYDDRILSRMVCGTIVELTGEDRRFSK